MHFFLIFASLRPFTGAPNGRNSPSLTLCGEDIACANF